VAAIVDQTRPRDCGGKLPTAALAVSVPIGASLMVLALGSPRLGWLGWFALVPLFAAIRLWRPAGALAAGALWGTSLCAGLAVGSDAAVSITWPSVVLAAALPAAYAFLGGHLTRWIGFSPFVLGVAWMGVELAFEPLGLRQGLLAGTQADGHLIPWISSAFGYVVAAFAVAFLNAWLVATVAGVRLPIGGRPFHTQCSDRGTRLPAPSLCCIRPCSASPAQPRAPPLPVAPGERRSKRSLHTIEFHGSQHEPEWCRQRPRAPVSMGSCRLVGLPVTAHGRAGV